MHFQENRIILFSKQEWAKKKNKNLKNLNDFFYSPLTLYLVHFFSFQCHFILIYWTISFFIFFVLFCCADHERVRFEATVRLGNSSLFLVDNRIERRRNNEKTPFEKHVSNFPFHVFLMLLFWNYISFVGWFFIWNNFGLSWLDIFFVFHCFCCFILNETFNVPILVLWREKLTIRMRTLFSVCFFTFAFKQYDTHEHHCYLFCSSRARACVCVVEFDCIRFRPNGCDSTAIWTIFFVGSVEYFCCLPSSRSALLSKLSCDKKIFFLWIFNEHMNFGRKEYFFHIYSPWKRSVFMVGIATNYFNSKKKKKSEKN